MNMKRRKLAAVVACRNNGSRLYGKPLQNLDINTKCSILDQVIFNIRNIKIIDEIVLAIASGSENETYIQYAEKNKIKFIIGDEIDVLKRLIDGLNIVEATDLFRVTSESPFLYFEPINKAWESHRDLDYDATFLDQIIDGCGFEIIKKQALKESWTKGELKHRSEFCSLFIRENIDIFKILKIDCPKELIRKDLRLTVDYPEDLIVCRAVFNKVLKGQKTTNYKINDIVQFLDEKVSLKSLLSPYCEEGYKTMYL